MNKLLLLLFSLLMFTHSFSQVKFNRDAENRFSGSITSNEISNEVEPNGLMKNFTLGIQWWDFLGEPMEFYSFKWESSGTIILGVGKILNREDLKKYPDLLKRFDNIKPIKLNLFISGNKDNRMDSDFTYKLSDWQILYSKAGMESKNLSPGSPKTWNDFWQWSWGLTNSEKYNLPNSEFENLSNTEKKELLSNLKAKYKNCHTIYLKAHIDKLEWPKYEIESIYNAFLKYEKGEETPSPLEEVKANKNSIAKATTYTKDDFWGELVDIEDPEVELFDLTNKYGELTKNVLREKHSKKVVIESKPSTIITSLGSLRKNFFDGYAIDYIWPKYSGAVEVEVRHNRIKLDKNNNIFKYYIRQKCYNTTPVYDCVGYGGSLYNHKGELVIEKYYKYGFFYIADRSKDSKKDLLFEKSGYVSGIKNIQSIMNRIAEQLGEEVYNEEIVVFEVDDNTYDVYNIDNFELIKKGVIAMP